MALHPEGAPAGLEAEPFPLILRLAMGLAHRGSKEVNREGSQEGLTQPAPPSPLSGSPTPSPSFWEHST